MSKELDNLKVQLVPIEELQLNPHNTNVHPPEQIERLAKVIKYQGWRWPIVATKEDKMIQAGEGRYLAAKHLGLKKVPVAFQEFIDDDQRRAFVTSDNAIASWAKLDYAKINEQIGEWSPDFDIDLLGIKDFSIDVPEIEMPELATGDKKEFEQITFILHASQAETIRKALVVAKKEETLDDGVNDNQNGNAISRICEWYLNG